MTKAKILTKIIQNILLKTPEDQITPEGVAGILQDIISLILETASEVPLDTSNFEGNLSTEEGTVQKAFDKLDDIDLTQPNYTLSIQNGRISLLADGVLQDTTELPVIQSDFNETDSEAGGFILNVPEIGLSLSETTLSLTKLDGTVSVQDLSSIIPQETLTVLTLNTASNELEYVDELGNTNTIPLSSGDTSGLVPYTGAAQNVDLGQQYLIMDTYIVDTDSTLDQVQITDHYSNTGQDTVLIGKNTGLGNSGNDTVALGEGAAQDNSGANVATIGNGAGSNNTGAFLNAFGVTAANGNTGSNVNAIGNSSATNNTGSNVNAFNINAATNNEGNAVNAFGAGAGGENTANYLNAIGEGAGSRNTGINLNAIGLNSSRDNTGSNVNSMGVLSAESNQGSNVNAFGFSAARDNTGTNVIGVGVDAARSNTGNNVTALGNEAGEGNTLDSMFIISNDTITTYANRASAEAAITLTNGASSGSTYLYLNSTTNAVEFISIG